MIAFSDEHRDAYWGEQICRVLPIARRLIAPCGAAEESDLASARERRDLRRLEL